MHSTVLVTGADGFVGGHLCRRLSESGRGVRGTVRGQAAEGWLHSVGDVEPGTEWGAALEGVESVVHLAARAHVTDEGAGDPLAQFRRVNAGGTERLARCAAEAGVRRMVYVSSVKVNGESTPEIPFTGEDEPEPECPYAVSKLEAERALERTSRQTGLDVVVLRPPLVYGPGVKANFLSLMRLVDSGLPLPLGSVENRRSLIYVGNLTSAIEACLDHPEAAGETFLVSDGRDFSMPTLIRHLARALDRPARLLPFPPSLLRTAGRMTGKSGAVERLLGSLMVDDSAIRRTLGWSPPYTPEEGFGQTAKWFREKARHL